MTPNLQLEKKIQDLIKSWASLRSRQISPSGGSERKGREDPAEGPTHAQGRSRRAQASPAAETHDFKFDSNKCDFLNSLLRNESFVRLGIVKKINESSQKQEQNKSPFRRWLISYTHTHTHTRAHTRADHLFHLFLFLLVPRFPVSRHLPR